MIDRREVLDKAIHAAYERGWKGHEALGVLDDLGVEDEIFLNLYIDAILEDNVFMALLVQHDFAEALWGSKPVENTIYAGAPSNAEWKLYTTAWQYHLQQMVIAMDPVVYLAENMPKSVTLTQR